MSDVFNWRLPPAPGFPGYQPPAQPPTQPQTYQRLNPPRPPYSSVDGRPYQPPPDTESTEPFIPSREDRPYSQWGTDDFALAGARNYPGIAPGPLMPQMRDIAQLIHGAVLGLGRFGSHYTGMPAIAMGTYANAYWTAYQKGMHERAGNAYQQYRMARQMTIDRGKEEMEEYAKIYAAYHDEKGNVTDPNGFHDALLTASQKYQNSQLTAAIQSGHPEIADRILQATDSHIMNLIKAQHQEQQQQKINELRDAEIQRLKDAKQREDERRKAIENERKKYDPSAVGPGPDYKPLPVDPASVPADTSPVPDTTPASDESGGASADPDISQDTAATEQPDKTTLQKPIQMADASGQVPIPSTPPSKPAPGLAPEGKPETDAIERAAKDYMWTGKLPPGVEKNVPDIAARMTTRAGQLKNWLDRLESDPNIDKDTIIPAVRKVFPQLADGLQAYTDGRLTLTAGMKNSEIGKRIIGLGEKVAPGFDATVFPSRQRAIAFWTNGDGGKAMLSLGMLQHHIERLLADIPNKPIPGTAWIDRNIPIEGGVTNRLDAEIEAVNQEFARAMSGKGGTIPELANQSKQLNLGMWEENMRQNLQGKLDLMKDRLEQLQAQFNATTGWPARDLKKRFEEFVEHDPGATNAHHIAADGLNKIEQMTKEGDRKQFKQGWGVFRGGKWVPEQ